ncbi:MAG TPA: TIGR02300 family protein [Thermoanaerobaculia bacterium]|nr:TIGR02300 family protein [Thermoanaerobaculia bacterium]
MPELKLGNKYECFNCGTKFYDLGKSDPLCPKCGANQRDAAQHESPAVSQAARRKRKAEVSRGLEAVEDEEDAIVEIPDEEIEPGEIAADLDAEEEEDFDDDEE